jgi:16S rRNA (cytosine1402-N4)-methyltransferase
MDFLTNYHAPVLAEEVCTNIVTNKSGAYFDGTLGFGGHAQLLLQRLADDAKYVATDVDEEAFRYCREKFKNDGRVRMYMYNFTRIDAVATIESLEGFDGILADLGVSSFQLDEKNSGFSFRFDAPLDMRMQKSLERTAQDILNEESEESLADIFFTYGEERASRKLGRLIVEKRAKSDFKTAEDLMEIIRQVAPVPYVNKTAGRVFQALRIVVNDELENLKIFLEKAVDLLLPGGRIGIISFHSLEDRIVKEAFKFEEKSCICPPGLPVCICGKVQRLKIITKKPVTASEIELKNNRRARSAKLRIAERI